MLYGLKENAPFYVRIVFELDHVINTEYMEQAVKLACKRYPYFMVKLEKMRNSLVFVDNKAPVLLYSDGENYTIDAEDNNGYLFRFSADGNVLTATFMHCLTDGRGIHRFVNTVLYYYFEKYNGCAPNAPDIWKITDEIKDTETLFPYDIIKESEGRINSNFDIEKAHISSEKEFGNGRQRIYRFSVKTGELMKYAKASDGTPNACIAGFLGQAVDSVDNVLPEKNIYIGVIIDGRTMLGYPETCNQLVDYALLEYSQKVKRLGEELTHTCYRGILNLRSDPAFNKGHLSDMKKAYDRLERIDTFEEKQKAAEDAIDMVRKQMQFTVSYPGRYVYEGISEHILACFAENENVNNTFSLAINNYNDNFDITVSTSFDATAYVKALMNIMEKHGIPVADKGVREVDPVKYTPLYKDVTADGR